MQIKMYNLLIFTVVALVGGHYSSSYGEYNSNMGQYNPDRQYNPSGQYGSAQPSGNEPGYLPDYQGDMYTSQRRIAETQALNRPFFDSIGGAPPAPPRTPAQTGGLAQQPNSQISPYSSSGNMYGSSYYSPSSGYSNQQYGTNRYGTGYQNPSSYGSGYYSGSSSSMSPYNDPSSYGSGYQNPSVHGSGYYSASSSGMSHYNDANSNSPTSRYNAALNTNLGYPNQMQYDQQNQYGQGITSSGYTGYSGHNGYNTQYGHYGQNRYQNAQLYNQQNGYGNPQGGCCGSTSTSCCYQKPSPAMTQSYGRKK